MKLLHLTNHFPPYPHGVAERQCSLLVRELSARNHLSHVLTSDVVQPHVHESEPHVIRRLRLASATSPCSFVRLFLIQQHNRRVLHEAMDAFLPDVVVVWGLAGLSYSLLWELHRRRIRTVFAVLDDWPRTRARDDGWYRWWAAPLPRAQKIVRRLLRRTGLDKPILHAHPAERPSDLPLRPGFFASGALRDSARLAGFDTTGTEVLPHCLAQDEIPPPLPRRDELRHLLWIGRLDPDHDPMTAVQVIQELRHRGEPSFALDLFGRGDLAMESRLRDLVRNGQLGGAVTLRHASGDEPAMLYPNYDVFVHTARHPDPFPLTIVRALAARVPVVAAPEGSAHDVVRNGENALTFRTGDAADCADKILRVVRDRALVERLTDRGAREVLETYSSGAVGGRLDRMLHAVLHGEHAV